MKIALRGHKPNKLYGYDLFTEKYDILGNKILKILEEENADWCISGGALGADQLFAIIAIKNKYKLEMAIPCLNHSKMWNDYSKALYQNILNCADKVTIVTEEEYSPNLMQIRNQYMVDNCDKLIAI